MMHLRTIRAFLSAFSLLSPFLLRGTETPQNTKTSCALEAPTLEAKVGYFIFADSKMRKIYKHGGVDVQLSTSYPVHKYLQLYLSAEFLEKHGRSLNSHQKTSIWQVPLSFGLKPVVPMSSCTQWYFTLGPRYVFLHLHNDSSFVDRNINHSRLGGFVNTGFNFFPLRHFLIDIFGEYSYVKMNVHPSKANVIGKNTQVGGYVFGLGLGYVF